MSWAVVKALLGHYRRYPLQCLLVWLGLTFGISLFIGVIAINSNITKSYQYSERLFANPLPYHIISNQLDKSIPYAVYIRLYKQGYKQCIPMKSLKLTSELGRSFVLTGITDTVDQSGLVLTPAMHDVLFGPFSTRNILVSAEFAKQNFLSSGDHIVLSSGKRIGPIVIDRSALVYGSRMLTSLNNIQLITNSSTLALITCGEMSYPKLHDLKQLLSTNLSVIRNSRSDFGSFAKALHLNLTTMAMLAFLVGLFIFYQAMSLSFVQRQPLVGMLRQAGVSGVDLTKSLLLEIGVFVLISSICGNVFGYGLALYLSSGLEHSVGLMPVGGIFGRIDWSWSWSLMSFLLALAGAGLSCVWPLVRLLQAPSIRLTTRLSMVRFAGKECLFQAVIALILFGVALLLYQGVTNPMQGVLIIVLIIIGVGLLTPYLIWKSFDYFSYRLRHVRLRWFFADSAASMSFRGIASMAFLIALSANITVATLVCSFRITTDTWLNQRLAADLYVYASPDSQASMKAWLSVQPDVKNVGLRWERDFNTRYGLVQLVTVGQSELESKSLTIKVAIPEYWEYLHHRKSVLISESMAIREHLSPGDFVTLPTPLRGKWLVAGVYYDYGNPLYQVTISDLVWKSRFMHKGNAILSVVAYDKSPAELTSLRNRFLAAFRIDEERVLDIGSIHQRIMDIFDHTFAIARTLGSITLIIAICGIFFATLAAELSRQRHFSLLRCLGVSGKELLVIGGLQLLLFGVISLVIALPLGIFSASLIIDIIIRDSFGWSIQLHLLEGEYIKTAIWTLCALTTAGILPMFKLIFDSPMGHFRDSF